MGYKFPGSASGGRNFASATNSAINSSYPAYAAASRAHSTGGYGSSSLPPVHTSAPPVYGGSTPISLSSSPNVSICKYCHQPRVLNPEFNVTHPVTKSILPTCSLDCNKKLLKSMMASYSEASTKSASNAVGSGYGVPSGQPMPSQPPYASYQTGGYAPQGHTNPITTNQSVAPPGWTPAPAATGYAMGTPSNPGYAPSVSHFPPNTSSASTYGSQTVPQVYSRRSAAPASLPTVAPGIPRVKATGASVGGGNRGGAPKQGKQQRTDLNQVYQPGPVVHPPKQHHDSQVNVLPGPNGGPMTTEVLNKKIEDWKTRRSKMPDLWQATTIILDTNVLLNGPPDAVFDLHRFSPELTFIVPYVLIQELDTLKNRSHNVAFAARQAISSLYEILVQGNKKEKWIRGQKQGEYKKFDSTNFAAVNADDRILECVNYFHSYSPKGKKAMLLTQDKNLTLKANVAGIPHGNIQDLKTFWTTYRSLYDERDSLKRQVAIALSRGDVVLSSDFKLEDYDPSADNDDDEFAKIKKEAEERERAQALQLQAKEKVAAEQALLLAQSASVRAILPSGTNTDIYDSSSDEEITHKDKKPSSAPSSSANSNETLSNLSSNTHHTTSTYSRFTDPSKNNDIIVLDSSDTIPPPSANTDTKKKDKKNKKYKKRKRDQLSTTQVDSDTAAPAAKKLDLTPSSKSSKGKKSKDQKKDPSERLEEEKKKDKKKSSSSKPLPKEVVVIED